LKVKSGKFKVKNVKIEKVKTFKLSPLTFYLLSKFIIQFNNRTFAGL